jgi:transposase
LKKGNKNDRVDARKLAELLRTNQVKAVYHEKHGTRALKELGRSYLTITKDMTRVMNRIKGVYRSWAIPCAGTRVYSPRHRGEWLTQLVEPGVRIRAEHLYQQLDSLEPVRLEARRQLLVESRKHAAVKLLRQIPSIGPIRAALLVALLQTPNRFRTKRQLWAYSGFAVEVHDSGEYRVVRGKLQRNRERITVRGLNDNHNKDVKYLFKSAAISASIRPGPLHDFYVARVESGMRPTMARLTLARKIAAITLTMWKKGASFDPKQLKPQAA